MKVGDYVRTDDCIGKVYDICHKEEDYYKFIIEKHGTLKICDSDYIVKSSPNIIDLIEVGDYVNGLKVDEIDEKGIYNYNSYDGWRINIASCNEEIKSIVTKEQFESMEYRIGE